MSNMQQNEPFIEGEEQKQLDFGPDIQIMRTKHELEKHWETNCEAFFFYCPDCDLPFKLSEEGHHCIDALNSEKINLEETLEMVKE